MKNLKMLSILLLLALLSGSIANAVEPNLMKKADKKGMEKWVNAQFKKMTKEERIAQ